MENRYLTVSALTAYLKRKMEMDPHLQEVHVKGEISNFIHHRSGHMYLSIKDDNTVIPAAMFMNQNQHLLFRPENGMNVLIRGQVNVYYAQGKYQLYIYDMQPDGVGALFVAYEQLKEKLRKAGYFDAQHKRRIEPFPTSIGLITSDSSAAVRDMITTIKRRFPIAEITVIPTIVQGTEAAPSIVQSIKQANEVGRYDTLIVGRGGGSIEELWAFNEELVVKAVFHSEIPIISAVGHETDTTLTDYVADLRAATPTAAAELAVPLLLDVKESLLYRQNQIQQLLLMQLTEKKRKLEQLRHASAFQSPKNIIYEKQQYIDHLHDKINYAMQTYIREKRYHLERFQYKLANQSPAQQVIRQKEKLSTLTKQLNRSFPLHIQKKQNQLANVIEKLTLVNPLHILQRGFALPLNKDKQVVRSVHDVEINDVITIEVNDGALFCHVDDKRGKTRVEGN